MKKSLIVIAILLSTIPALCGPLVVSSNPRYFTDGTGKAIYLTGMHTWGNLHDFGQDDPPAAFDFEWFNPATGVITPAAQTTGGATRSMTPPFSGPAVLYLLASLPAASRLALAVSGANTAFAVAPVNQALTVHWPE